MIDPKRLLKAFTQAILVCVFLVGAVLLLGALMWLQAHFPTITLILAVFAFIGALTGLFYN